MEAFTDETLMPFGKYEGVKMANVPEDYLIWAYNNFRYMPPPMKKYIEESIDKSKLTPR